MTIKKDVKESETMEVFHGSKSKIIFIIIAATAYGLSTVITKMGLNAMLEVSSYTFLTMMFATMFLLPYYISVKEKKITMNDYKNFFILGLIASGIAHLLIFFGQSYTSAINAGFLVKMATPFTAIFALIILREKIGKIGWTAILISLFGCLLLSTQGKITPQIGDSFILLAASLLGFSNVFAKNLMKKHSSTTVVFWRSVFGSIVLFVISFLYIKNPFLSISSYAVLNGLLIAITLACLYKSFDIIGPTFSSALFLTSSVISLIFAMALLGEFISPVQLLGGVIILIGVALMLKNKFI